MSKKMLAILGLSTFTFACGNNAPAGPSPADLVAAPVAEQAGSAAADAVPGSCKGVLEVQLRAGTPSREGIEITASYLGTREMSCPAPAWSTATKKLELVARKDPFRILARPTTAGSYEVTATAPSGLKGNLKLEF